MKNTDMENTDMKNTEQTLGDLVTAFPAAAKVFQQYRLDYCCGGKQSLREACTAEEVDVEAVLRDIESQARAMWMSRDGTSVLSMSWSSTFSAVTTLPCEPSYRD